MSPSSSRRQPLLSPPRSLIHCETFDFIECEQKPRPKHSELCINPLALYYNADDPTMMNHYRDYKARYPLAEDMVRREQRAKKKYDLIDS